MAVRAADVGDVARVVLFGRGERHLAVETEDRLGFAERGVDADAAIEDEAFAVEVGAAAFLEIFQDAAVELVDVFEAGELHERAGFFAADAAGAEQDEGAVFEFRGQALDGVGEFAEVVDVRNGRAAERAHAHLVVVAGVEQGDGAALVEPLFEGARGEFGRGPVGGIDAGDAEGDDLFLDLYEHAVERRLGADALFGGEVGETGDGAQFGDEGVDVGAGAGDEQVDALGAEEHGAAESARVADRAEMIAELGQAGERRELVDGDVDEVGHGAVRGRTTRCVRAGKLKGGVASGCITPKPQNPISTKVL